MNAENRCPACDAELAANAPRGLCPACLLKGGLGTQTRTGGSGSNPREEADFVPPTPAELAPHFPELEILELAGRGGMGVVYKARQKRLDRLVALKILSPTIGQDPAFAERFAREARAMGMLNHPHIVAVYDFGQTEGEGSSLPSSSERGAGGEAASLPSPSGRGAGGEGSLYYFLMEFVDGVSLRRLLDTGKLAPEEALAIVPQICEALQYAHDHGVVHRDIKPENVLLDKEGRVKIADFGIAKLVGREAKDLTLTGAGQIVGTPQYMAPEQIEHPLQVDHRVDIYSLGVVFYQMLTGELPIGRFAPPSKKVQIDVRLDEVVLRALEKEPELRYQQANEVKTEVETITTTPRPMAAVGASRFDRRAAAAIAVIRWTARILGTLLLLGLVLFVIGEARESITTQPAPVRVEFVSLFLMALGMAIGWKWEGWAALLILAGEAQFHIVEWRLLLQGPLELPLIVGMLYGLCWWMQRSRAAMRRDTGAAAGNAPPGSAERAAPVRLFGQSRWQTSSVIFAVLLIVAFVTATVTFFRAPKQQPSPAEPPPVAKEPSPSLLASAEEQAIDALLGARPAPAGMVRSRVLCKEMLQLMVEVAGVHAKAEGGSPADTQSPQHLGRFVQEVEKLEKTAPNLLLVTREQERQFAAGEFDDALNAKVVEETLKMLKDFELQLPALSQYLVAQFRAGKFSGARLEVARRILGIHIQQLIKQLNGGPDAARQPAPLGQTGPLQSPRAAEMRTIVLAALEYATEHPDWPKTLDELKPQYLDADRIDLGQFAYHPMGDESPEKNPPDVVLLSEKEPSFAGGQLVGFADGYIEYIRDPERLKRLLTTETRPPQAK